MSSTKESLNAIIDRLQVDTSFTERTSAFVLKRTRRTRAIKRSLFTASLVAFSLTGFWFSGRVSDGGPLNLNASFIVSRAELATQTQTQMRWAETDDVISSALANR